MTMQVYTFTADWQPFNTAPDEGNFLVYVGTEVLFCRSRLNARGKPIRIIDGEFIFDLLVWPTHWAPLPSDPMMRDQAILFADEAAS